MKGHIRERSPGCWAIVLDVRDTETGKRKRRWHSFRGTKRAAQIECARLIAEIQRGAYIAPDKTTFAEFAERWLAHIKSQVTPKSYERYAGLMNQNIKPMLGGVVLTKLRPVQISGAYTKALANGRRDGKDGGLSPRTVGHIHRVLKQSLSQAVKWEMLTRNPADAVDPPKVEWKPVSTYDLPQTAEIIETVRGKPIFMPVLLAALCGLRRGEICALRWRHVDFDAAQISVVESLEQTKAGLRVKSPKSGKGRTVALSVTMIEELRSHRLQGAQNALKLGRRLSDEDFVVGHIDGAPMPPIYVSQQWGYAIVKTKLARLRFHDLRHAHATHMLANGVHPKVASERLGHSRVGITLDLYSHVIPGMQEDAVEILDQALKTAMQGRKKPIG